MSGIILPSEWKRVGFLNVDIPDVDIHQIVVWADMASVLLL